MAELLDCEFPLLVHGQVNGQMHLFNQDLLARKLTLIFISRRKGVVGTYWKRLGEALLMSTHNI